MNSRGYMILGGMFGLGEDLTPKNRHAEIPFLRGNPLLLVNARSGINILVDALRPSQVWLPSYLCDVMLSAVKGSGVRPKIRFYEVDYDLKVASSDWLANVGARDLVVFVDYFGFPHERDYSIAAQSKGAVVLEDACQALLTKRVGDSADYVLFSPRKFLGIPDGGVLTGNTQADLFERKLNEAPQSWWLNAFRATLLRRDFDLYGVDQGWYALFKDVESKSPTGHFSISGLSKSLFYCFNYSEIADKRAKNFTYLQKSLGKFSLYTDLPNDVVPLGFPIRCTNRDLLRKALVSKGIYPPIHWSISGIVPKHFASSHELANCIMTLPCDQRCGVEDMQRMADIVTSIGIAV